MAEVLISLDDGATIFISADLSAIDRVIALALRQAGVGATSQPRQSAMHESSSEAQR